MGARTMRELASSAARAALCDMPWPPTDGDLQVDAVLARIADLPLPEMPQPASREPAGWGWRSGPNNEYYTNGPFADRADAVAALDGERGYIVEAVQGAVRFDAERLINDQYFEDDSNFDFDNMEPDRTGGGDVADAADAELQALLDGWVARWRHTFVTPNMFAATRGEEFVAGVCEDCGQDCGDACPADQEDAA